MNIVDEKSMYRAALEKIAGLDDQGNPTGCQSHLECIHTAQVVLVSIDSNLYENIPEVPIIQKNYEERMAWFRKNFSRRLGEKL